MYTINKHHHINVAMSMQHKHPEAAKLVTCGRFGKAKVVAVPVNAWRVDLVLEYDTNTDVAHAIQRYRLAAPPPARPSMFEMRVASRRCDICMGGCAALQGQGTNTNLNITKRNKA